MAAAMANDIALMIDSTFIEMLQEAGEKYLAVIESQYHIQEALVMSYEDSLMQSGLWTESLTGFNPLSIRASGLRVSESDAVPFSPEYIRFSSGHQMAIEDLGILRKKYTEAKMAATEKLPYTLIINHAKVPEMKAFPDRSSIVILSAISVLLFVMIVTIIVDGIKMAPGLKETR
jgi:capsule polysaccharide export protein KpsE/RkpR